mmetsp:Transcript_30966/g.60799  ORF Transcript_30966/g.60799 Transcript_30966/m.60799 type:complete len:361 (-) Transcript_30966:112-1194(-)|eukprot:CAMPEP_0172829006 /NCGR_PEP_ID=MMETSP1075-20121228/21226_1 /TAXON_ID=2916 /ORGANISM="Ceratium fusus, Strain PA161109" /LENGTH=360 /DNA_ID=CAMNT_0013671075 /DNA_START=49 /DNA_END=1131 /DNA_ORIENTATION=-
MVLRKIGKHGMELPPVGIGLMSVGGGIMAYDKEKDEAAAFEMIESAIEASKGELVHLDTADIYGPFESEKFVGECVKKFGRDKFFIATKFGCLPCFSGQPPGGNPDYVKQACADALDRMGIECIDLFYQHRHDMTTPIEDTCKALVELKDAGKIMYIGLSEAPTHILERAVKVAPISCIQQEWSLLCRDLEKELVPKCRELGIGIVTYSPVARGILTGQFKTAADLPQDWRKGGEAAGAPDYMSEEKLESNLMMASKLWDFAKSKDFAPAALASAWVLSRGDDVVVIPGTKKKERLLQNFSAVDVLAKLTPEDLKACEDMITPVGEGSSSGTSRYTGGFDGIAFNGSAVSAEAVAPQAEA